MKENKIKISKGIEREDFYVDAKVKAMLEKSKKIPSSIWYPHKTK